MNGVKLVLDREKFRSFNPEVDDIWYIGDHLKENKSALPFIYQGMTLLHELGHVYNLWGSGYLGGSAIIDQDGGAADPSGFRNFYNMNIIFNECASHLFGMEKQPLRPPPPPRP